MFRLRIGYLITGITTGLLVLFGFFWTIPDGKLHLVFCDVGQGDGAYIRFPDGRDMLVDGGPNNKVLECLGNHMPFWDRHINLVLMTHPQKDHLQGLTAVLDRYSVDYFVRSDVANTTQGYRQLMDVVARRKIKEKFVTTGEAITVGATTLSVLWPSEDQIANFKRYYLASSQGSTLQSSVLGASAPPDLNDGSIVFSLRYGFFDALFPGDADTRVENEWAPLGGQALGVLEVLKFPHHGSKTGMSEEVLSLLRPKLAVISVGKNSYGHPAQAVLATLEKQATQVKRTDKEGDVVITSDGRSWQVEK